jgi:CHAD domain-containing protein
MAKATEVALDPDAAFADAAREIVAVRSADLWANEERVLDTDDIERVHDMRVATRRLRAVLEIFSEAFDPDQLEDVLRDVKRLADALGERRDPDVHIDAMTRFAEGVRPEERPGVEALIAVLRERQAHGNEVLTAELERARETGLAGRLEALV